MKSNERKEDDGKGKRRGKERNWETSSEYVERNDRKEKKKLRYGIEESKRIEKQVTRRHVDTCRHMEIHVDGKREI